MACDLTHLFTCAMQEPILNIKELKDIHSEINLSVPDPILLSDIHDGLDAVRAWISQMLTFE